MNADTQQRNNRRTLRQLLLAVVAMFAFGYALVPIYSVFCRITGLNGKTVKVEELQAEKLVPDPSRIVTIEFVTTTNAGMPWDFKPTVAKIKVHPGELTEVEFMAQNLTARAMTGQAVPSLAPGTAARYFKKTECFCFRRQSLAAHEQRLMPVRFVVDPALPAEVTTLTLSYTFFSVQDAADAQSAPNKAGSKSVM